jgi:hypothetical protein
VNVKNADGEWVPIDTRLVERPARGGGEDARLESALNDVVVSVAGPARRSADGASDAALGSWQELASVTLPSGGIFGYGLEGATPVRPVVD